jgi:hypothetical protein
MNKPTIRIHNVISNEIIDREMNAEELAQYEAELEVANTKQATVTQQAEQRAALLERLGITEEEAKLLLS